MERQWNRDDDEFAARVARRAQGGSLKAWRFAGEMEEIAATFAEADLPPQFHLAAAEVYRRLAGFKDHEGPPELEAIVAALRATTDD